MFKAIGRKIEKIRNSEESTKRKWVIGMSAISMIIVVFLWFSYINTVINPATVNEKQASKNEFWSIMKNGLALVSEEIKGKVGEIFSGLMGEREIEISK